MRIYLILLTLLLLVGCMSKYDINLSEVSFDHDGNVDIIGYVASNPTNYDLSCEITFNLAGHDNIIDYFGLEPGETKNLTTTAQMPVGSTQIAIDTRCKPSS